MQDAVRSRTTERIVGACDQENPVLVEAPPASGKTYNSVRLAAEEGEKILYLTARRDLYAQAIEEAEKVSGIDAMVIPSPYRDCPTFADENDGETKKARKLYQKGLSGEEIHYKPWNTVNTPCQGRSSTCPYLTKRDKIKQNADEIDLLIGNHQHAHVPRYLQGRTVVFDEFNIDPFLTRFPQRTKSGERRNIPHEIIGAFLETVGDIALFLIPFIYLIYAESGLTVPGGCTTSICTLFKDGVGLPMMLGLLRKDEIDGSRALILTRVSTTAQGNNSSKKSQREHLMSAAEGADLEITNILEAEESAAKIERGQLNEALEQAHSGDYDVLMVYEFDRLSRANPWETLDYLNDLRKSDTTLYIESYGYFDWHEHFDLEILTREAVFARQNLNRIRKGARDGCHRKLKDGQWPFGNTLPVGYRTNEDDELLVDENYGPFISDFFEIYAKTENRKETMRRLNNKFEEHGLDSISYSRVKTVLQSPLCLGRLTYKGEVVAEMPELRQVHIELFQEVQSILSDEEDHPTTPEVPEFAADAVEQYGLDFVMDQFESFKPFRCRKCGGDLERHGSKEVWGIPIAKYRCQECEYQGPLMTEQELKSLHQTVPVRCPFCTSTENFRSSTRRQLGMQFNYAYECLDCGLSFGSDLSPDRLKRIFSHPNLGFDIEGSDDTDSKDDDDDEDDPQPAITDYGNP